MQPQLPESIELIHLACVESTNDTAKQLAANGAKGGTLVWADEQTRGRGRGGHEWHSPLGNLYSTIILRPGKPAKETAGLSFIAALAIGDAVQELLPQNATLSLKWPNDVLIDGKKVAGILLESATVVDDDVKWVVVGCGVNIANYPELQGNGATSLANVGCEKVNIGCLLESYIQHLFFWEKQWQVSGFSPIRTAWLQRATGIGKRVRVRLSADNFEGLFTDMDASGALLLELPDGRVRRVTAGDVFLSE